MLSLEFPKYCASYLGLHSVECLNTIWVEQGCLLNSPHSPANASSEELETYVNQSITYQTYCVFIYHFLNITDFSEFQNLVSGFEKDALAGIDDKELKCWGLSKYLHCNRIKIKIQFFYVLQLSHLSVIMHCQDTAWRV